MSLHSHLLASGTNNVEPRLVALAPRTPAYNQLESYFLQGWRHPEKPMPRVQAIFEIFSPDKLFNPYLKYRYEARLGRGFVFSLFSDGVAANRGSWGVNEQFLFHGTKRSCSLGDSLVCCTSPCSSSQCSLCAVIRNSFQVARSGNRHKFRRFGKGIYTTSCSSKADDYYAGLDDSPFRVVLLNRVVVGTPSVHTNNAQGLKVPPRGYDSVVGVPGGDLNYEETVVYSNDAIRPGYLVVYDPFPQYQMMVPIIPVFSSFSYIV